MTGITTTESSAAHRHWRNYLLEPKFQLKFTSYIVAVTLVVACGLGAFLWTTTRALFHEIEAAVEARSRAAETSRELGAATLNNQLLEHMNDPAFETRLREQSRAIDAAYEAEKAAILAQRTELVRKQKFTVAALVGGLTAFVVFIALAGIVMTHRIVGPLYRLKRMAQEASTGQLGFPKRPPREHDEFKDVFEAFTGMVDGLRKVQLSDSQQVGDAINLAERGNSASEVVGTLRRLQDAIKARIR